MVHIFPGRHIFLVISCRHFLIFTKLNYSEKEISANAKYVSVFSLHFLFYYECTKNHLHWNCVLGMSNTNILYAHHILFCNVLRFSLFSKRLKMFISSKDFNRILMSDLLMFRMCILSFTH